MEWPLIYQQLNICFHYYDARICKGTKHGEHNSNNAMHGTNDTR